MKKLTFVAIFTMVAIFAIGQKDAKAKKILKEVSEKTKTYATIKLKFLYIMDNRVEKVQDTTKGTIYIKGNMFKLFFKGVEVFSDGKTVWNYSPELQELNINEPDAEDDNALNPSNILRVYEKGFKYKFMGEFADGKNKFYQIDLYPEKPNEVNYSIIKLKIDKAKKQVQSMKIIGKDGIDFIVKLTQFKPNVKVVDSMFKFDASKYPKNLEINDMR